jgi:hypothetical protein
VVADFLILSSIIENMKKLLQTILIVGIFAVAFHFRFELNRQFRPQIDQIRKFLHLSSSLNPCIEPIPYNIGNFDNKFGISQEYFLSALAEAEKIWEKPYGKELFEYKEFDTATDTLKINLVYDYRQQATKKLSNLGIAVENTRASYESLKIKLDSLESEYEQEKISFNRKVESFNQKQSAYERDVDYWNKRGGAPEGEYEKLVATQASLDKESNQIKVLQNNLNEKADEINALVVVLNRLINTLNLSVDKYNTVNVSRGETFEEGLYVSDGLKSEIDIYEFSDRTKLVRVLAHELGHSLGLEHVSDPKAIMYELNQSENMTLTSADMEALKKECEKK